MARQQNSDDIPKVVDILNTDSDQQPTSEARSVPCAELNVTSLEPRILLSTTWVDADTGDPQAGASEGDDIFTGDNAANTADGLGGDDVLSGGLGADTLFGGSGDDILYGEKHDDYLDGGAGDDQLFGGQHQDTLVSGGGDDYMSGGQHDDTFRFDGAEDGDTITVDGGQHNDTIDLSAYSSSDLTDDGSTITVDMGGGESFTVNYSNVETILTSDGSFNPGEIPDNEDPTAVGDSFSTDEDTPLTTLNVLTNDTDLDGDSLSVDSFTQPSHGTVTYNNDGTFTYTPVANYNGSDSFEYTVTDSNGGTDTATVSLIVDPVDDTIVDAGPDQVVDENTLVTLSASAYDTGPALSFDDVSVDSYAGAQDAGATVAVEDGGATLHITGNGWKQVDFDYDVTENTVLEFDFRSDQLGEVQGIGFDSDNTLSPNQTFQLYGTQNWGVSDYADYTGSEGEWKHYRIEVGNHFTGSFDRLIFANDHDAGARNGESMFRNVSVYEDDGAAEPAYTYSWTQLTGPPVALDDNTSESPTFTAPDVTTQTDVTFRVTVSDGSESWIDDVTITVDPVEDYTRVDAGPDQIVDEDMLVSLSATVSDQPPALSFDDVSVDSYAGAQDAGATVAVEDDGATLHITGNGWKQVDFDYDVTENTVLEFDFRSDQLGEVQGIGFDSDNTLSPNQTFQLYGTQSWGVSDYATYTGSEGEWVHFRIEVGDHFTGSFDRLVFANDHDAGARNGESMFRNLRVYEDDGAAAPDYSYSWTQVGGPLVSLDNDTSESPTFTAPNVTTLADVSFQVTVSDGNESWVDDVTITINPINDAPQTAGDSYTTNEDTPLTTGDVLANDTDIDGDPLSVDSFTQPSHGAVSYNNDGTFTYTPAPDFHGSDAFDYTITDSQGGTSTATVSLTVQPVEDVVDAEEDEQQNEVDQGLAVAADEAAMRNAGAEAERLIGQAEGWLAEGLSDGDDRLRVAEAARSLEPSQSPGTLGGGPAAVDWDIKTDAVASDDLIPATYINTRAGTAADDTRLDYELAEPTEVVGGSTDEETASDPEKPGPGRLAALWGMLRALGGTRRPNDEGAHDKSRDESHRRH